MDMIFLKQKKFIKNQMEFKKLLIKEDQMEKPQDLLKKKMTKLEIIIKKILKGIEEDGIKNFNKEYDDYCKKCEFRKNFYKLNLFEPFIFG